MPQTQTPTSSNDPLSFDSFLKEHRTRAKQQLGITKKGNEFGAPRPGHIHAGLDIGGSEGETVETGADAKVIFRGFQKGYGNVVYLEHPDGTTSRYAHLKEFKVEEGDRIKKGVPIGIVGRTGNAKGPHVHYERRDLQGLPIDPLNQDFFPSIAGRSYEFKPEEVPSIFVSPTADSGDSSDPLSFDSFLNETGQQPVAATTGQQPSPQQQQQAGEVEPPSEPLDVARFRSNITSLRLPGDAAQPYDPYKNLQQGQSLRTMVKLSPNDDARSIYYRGYLNMALSVIPNLPVEQAEGMANMLADRAMKRSNGQLFKSNSNEPLNIEDIKQLGETSFQLDNTEDQKFFQQWQQTGIASSTPEGRTAEEQKEFMRLSESDRGITNIPVIKPLVEGAGKFISSTEAQGANVIDRLNQGAELFGLIDKNNNNLLSQASNALHRRSRLMGEAAEESASVGDSEVNSVIRNASNTILTLGMLKGLGKISGGHPLIANALTSLPVDASLKDALQSVGEAILLEKGMHYTAPAGRARNLAIWTAIPFYQERIANPNGDVGQAFKHSIEFGLLSALGPGAKLPDGRKVTLETLPEYWKTKAGRDLMAAEPYRRDSRIFKPEVGEQISHKDSSIDGKTVVSKDSQGRVIVANEENKTGVSKLKTKDLTEEEKERAAMLLGVEKEKVGDALKDLKAEVDLALKDRKVEGKEDATRKGTQVQREAGQTGEARSGVVQEEPSKRVEQESKVSRVRDSQQAQEPEQVDATVSLPDGRAYQRIGSEWFSGTTTTGKKNKVTNAATVVTLNRMEQAQKDAAELSKQFAAEEPTAAATPAATEITPEQRAAEYTDVERRLTPRTDFSKWTPEKRAEFQAKLEATPTPALVKAAEDLRLTEQVAEVKGEEPDLSPEKFQQEQVEIERNAQKAIQSISKAKPGDILYIQSYAIPNGHATFISKRPIFGSSNDLYKVRTTDGRVETFTTNDLFKGATTIENLGPGAKDLTFENLVREGNREVVGTVSVGQTVRNPETKEIGKVVAEKVDGTAVVRVPGKDSSEIWNVDTRHVVEGREVAATSRELETNAATGEVAEVAKPAPEPSAAAATEPINHYRQMLNELDALNSPDIDYRKLLSTGTKDRLKKGETWRSRALKLVESQERLGDSVVVKEEPISKPTKQARVVSSEDVRPAGVKVKKSSDFAMNGEWEVTLPNGVTRRIFRDPEDTNWYDVGAREEDPHDHLAGLLSTSTKNNAIQALLEKHGKTIAEPEPEVEEALPRYQLVREADAFVIEDTLTPGLSSRGNKVVEAGRDKLSLVAKTARLNKEAEVLAKEPSKPTRSEVEDIIEWHRRLSSLPARTRGFNEAPAASVNYYLGQLRFMAERFLSPEDVTKAEEAKIAYEANDISKATLLSEQLLNKIHTKIPTIMIDGRPIRSIDDLPESEYGTRNKLVNKESADKAKQDLKDLWGRTSPNDITVLFGRASTPLIKLGAYHIEAGAREFTDWVKKMAEDLTPEQWDLISPHLPDLYAASKQHMDSIYGPAAVEKITSLIKQAAASRKKTEKLYTEERSKRIERFDQTLLRFGGGEEAALSALGELKGELPKDVFDPIRTQISSHEADALYSMIANKADLGRWEKVKGVAGLRALLNPDVTIAPSESELAVLQRVYGRDFTKAVLKLRSRGQAIWDEFLSFTNIPRTLLASFDLSAPFRQGMVLSATHPIHATRAFKAMIKSWGSEKYADQVMRSITGSPLAETREKAGLYQSHWGAIGDSVAAKEEFYALTGKSGELLHSVDRWLENKLSVDVGENQYQIGYKGLAASERAYLVYLNKLRADVFDNVVRSNPDATVEQLEGVAQFINYATGRGDLGMLEKAAPLLNNLFFSPRFFVSRFQTAYLGAKGVAAVGREAVSRTIHGDFGHPPSYDYPATSFKIFDARSAREGTLEPTTRTETMQPEAPRSYRASLGNKMAARDFVSFVGGGMSFLGLLAAAAKATDTDLEVGFDPRNADFGKIRVGNTRVDIWGGMQQPARYAAQLILGQRVTLTGDKAGQVQSVPRDEIIYRYLRSKESPQASFIHDLYLSRKKKINEEEYGTNFIGKPVTFGGAVRERMFPLAQKDIYEAIQEDRRLGGSGLTGGLLGSLGIFGFGVTTIPPRNVDYDPYGDFATWVTRQ